MTPERVPAAGVERDATGVGSDQFPCPRCRTEVSEPYYGPCPACRTELRATVGGPARQIDTPAYEPRANVVPNAVATKE